ncbi:MAG: histone H1-like repetitive region-containing protein [Treponema sp.]|nr:histone H1-like repetitive region-containing protein [Treponema sp.]
MAVKKTSKKQVSGKKTAKKPAPKKAVIKKPAAKKPAANKTTVKKPVAKKAAAKKPAVKKTTVKKTAVKKQAASKTTVKKPVSKKAAVNKSVAKKTAVKKPAASKIAAKNPVVKKIPLKKPAEKKSAVKKPDVKKTAAKKPEVKAVKKPKDIIKKPAPKANKAVKTGKKTAAKKSSEWMSVDQFRDGLNFKNTTLAAKGASLQKTQPSRSSKKDEGILTDKEIAALYLKQEKYNELETLCKYKVSDKETNNNPFWHETLSDVYCHFGRWQEAVDVNKKRTAVFPNEWQAWNTLAVIYAVLGDYKNAADTIKKAEGKVNWDISYDEPDMNKEPPMYEEFFAYSKEGDPSSFSGVFWPKNAMFTLYPKILNNAPKSVFGWYSLAKFLGDSLHYFNEAVEAVEKAVNLKPDWKPALAYHAQMLSFSCKMNYDDGYFKETDQKEKEKTRKQELGVKAKEAYDKWKKAAK